MTHDNPFAAVQPAALPATADSRRPLALIALVACLACLLDWAGGWLLGVLSMPELNAENEWLYAGQTELSRWLPDTLELFALLHYLVLGGLSGWLIARYWQERGALPGMPLPRLLLPAVLLTSSLVLLLVSLGLFPLLLRLLDTPFAEQLTAGQLRTLLNLGNGLFGILGWLLGLPLVIGLLLRGWRSAAQRMPARMPLPRLEAALCFALCVMLLVHRLLAMSLLPLSLYDDRTTLLAIHLLGLLAGLLALAVASWALPARLQRLRPLALFGASLACVLIWGQLTALLGALLLVVLLLARGDFPLPVLALLGLLPLALLVGLAGFSLRLIYRPEACSSRA